MISQALLTTKFIVNKLLYMGAEKNSRLFLEKQNSSWKKEDKIKICGYIQKNENSSLLQKDKI